MATDVFSEVDLLPSDGNLPDLQQRESMIERWFDQIDDWCERMGDRLNPILVKETRQALKSRQFMVTFSVLLFAALAWTIVGSLSQMPNIYTTPSSSTVVDWLLHSVGDTDVNGCSTCCVSIARSRN